MTVERDVEDESPGFRFGRFGSSAPSTGWRRPESKNPMGTGRPASLEDVRNRPLPPKVPDADFVPDPMSSFRVGDRIEHNRFGVGKVLEISGQVPEIKAKVAVERFGEKILLLKYAKIRHYSLQD